MVKLSHLSTRNDSRGWTFALLIAVIFWMIFFGAAIDKAVKFGGGTPPTINLAAHSEWKSWLAFNSQLAFPTFFVKLQTFGNFTNFQVDHSIITCNQMTPAGDQPLPHNFAAGVCSDNQKNCGLFNSQGTFVQVRGSKTPIVCTAQAYDANNNPVPHDFSLALCDVGTPGDTSRNCQDITTYGAQDFMVLGAGTGNMVSLATEIFRDQAGKITSQQYSLLNSQYKMQGNSGGAKFNLFFRSYDVWNHQQTSVKVPPIPPFDFYVFMTFMAAATYLSIGIHHALWWIMKKSLFPLSPIKADGSEDSGFASLNDQDDAPSSSSANQSYGATSA